MAQAGRATPVLAAAALLPATAAATALAQTYGADSEFFSLNRVPGGTFGNRNFVAHLCAVGLPILAYLALSARRAAGTLAATAALAAATATLVLTRSRGAWLAAGVAIALFATGVWRAAAARCPEGRPPDDARRPRLWLAPALGVIAAGAAVAAVQLPNTLDWRSRSPYLDSARDVVNYRQGSGRGRLAQWRNSARLAAQAPVLGVGPGNWSVRYPSVAPAPDPSLTSAGVPANPWPSSDWVAFATERGIAGALPLAVAFVLLLWRAHRLVWRAPTAADRLRGGALGALLGATLTAGAFDAVLLLAAPTFLAWVGAGALTGDAAHGRPLLPRGARLLAPPLLASAAVGAAHATAMQLFSTGRPRAVEQAAALAPGDYRIQLRAAQLAAQAARCGPALERAAAAQRLRASSAPARVRRICRSDRPTRRP